jgi:hypothetical protein
LEDIAVLPPVFADAVTSWPRIGVVLVILIAIALIVAAVFANVRGTAVAAAHEPLDAPAITPSTHEPVISRGEPTEGDVTSQNRQPYDPATGNSIASDLTEGEREPFDI